MPKCDIDIPRITNRPLFGTTGESAHIYIVGAQPSDWYRFAQAYKAAADVLASRITDSYSIRITESIYFPILFLYRHYVELSLKGLLIDIGELTDQEQVTYSSHSLTPLWNSLLPKLQKINGRGSEAWFSRAATIIGELETLDQKSFTFRYPVDTQGEVILQSPTPVDIHQFSSVIQELAILLNGASIMLSEYLGFKYEMESISY